MQRPAGNDLSSADRGQIRALADRFRQAAPRNGPVDLDGFLPDPADRLFAPALRELVKCDLGLRWRNGVATYVEDYVRRYPTLANDADALTQLLYEEYTIRRRHGDRPSLTGYEDRFPGQFADLERLARGSDEPPDVFPVADPRQTGALLPVFGGYRLVKRIGRGSYGEVWQAEAPGGIDTAIKVIFRPLHHAVAQRELESLELVKRLRHPFLLQTQAYWQLEDRLIIAMELADGSLADRLKECARAGEPGIPAEELLVYTREACEALDYLHGKSVLHRDIKPDNLLLVERHVKVADFGLARMMQAQMARMTIRGTPAFMPPESWSGQTNEKSDQYSLAGSYVELRLNRQLFPADDIAGVRMHHLERTPDLDPLSVAEQRALFKALAKEPGDRFANCTEFWEALRKAVAPPAPLPRSGGIKTTVQQDAPMVPDGVIMTPPEVQPPPADRPRGTVRPETLQSTPAELALPRAVAAPPLTTGARSLSPKVLRMLVIAVMFLAGIALGILLIPKPQPPPPKVFVPEGFTATAGAAVVTADGRPLYDRIERVVDGGGRLEFVLVAATRPDDPPTFYLMRDKVTNQAFRDFATRNPQAVPDAKWQDGPKLPGNNLPVGIAGLDNYPVVRITVDEANAFAGRAGGRLPTAREWDKAAGRFDGAPVGPYEGDGTNLTDEQAGVGTDKLWPADRKAAVASPFGCRDMAGNSYEWTCSVKGEADETVPYSDTAWNGRVLTRGQTYLYNQPYRFGDSETTEYRRFNPETKQPGYAADVSFRVAVEVPPAR